MTTDKIYDGQELRMLFASAKAVQDLRYGPIAEEIGCGQGYLSRWVTGRVTMSNDLIEAALEAVGLDVELCWRLRDEDQTTT